MLHRPSISLLLLLTLRLSDCYDYRKHYQAYKHEQAMDLLEGFQPGIETDDFALLHVLSGREAHQLSFAQSEVQNDLLFDMALLRVPEEVGKKLPSHKIRFSSGLDSALEAWSKDPSLIDSAPMTTMRASPGLVPRPDDRESITSFAMMCSNAYILHSILGDWRNMTDWDQVAIGTIAVI